MPLIAPVDISKVVKEQELVTFASNESFNSPLHREMSTMSMDANTGFAFQLESIPTMKVLEIFYQSLHGEKWYNNLNWFSMKPLNEWFGLKIDEFGQVLEINLPNNNLEGFIPSCIGSLRGLHKLSLDGNNVKGILYNILSSQSLARMLTVATELIPATRFLKYTDIEMTRLMKLCDILDGKLNMSSIQEINRHGSNRITQRNYTNLFLSLCDRQHPLKQKNPIKVIVDIKYCFFELMEYLLQNQSTTAPLTLVKFHSLLKVACSQNELFEIELKSLHEAVTQSINEIFSFSSMQVEGKQGRLILFSVLLPELPIIQPDHENLMMIILQDNRFIHMCLENDLKSVFRNMHIDMLMSDTFWFSSKQSHDELQHTPFYNMMCRPRYCPATMFYIKCASNVMLLILTSNIIQSFPYTFGSTSSDDFVDTLLPSAYPTFAPTAMATTLPGNPILSVYVSLYLFIPAFFLFEFGKLFELEWNVSRYFSNVWNQIDCLSLLFLFWWFVSACAFESKAWYGNLALSVSTIPQTMSLLQYLCLNRQLGKLVLIIIAMFKDIKPFLIIFVFIILGFGLTFTGLYPVPKVGEVMLLVIYEYFIQFFSYTNGGADFSLFLGSTDPVVVTSGILVVVYVTLTTIILLNLLIAAMSNTYEYFRDKSQEEYAYQQATILMDYVRVYENNPMTMLPPPLNLLSCFHALLNKLFFQRCCNLWSKSSSNSDRTTSYVSTLANIIIKMIVFPIVTVVLIIEFGTLSQYQQYLKVYGKAIFIPFAMYPFYAMKQICYRIATFFYQDIIAYIESDSNLVWYKKSNFEQTFDEIYAVDEIDEFLQKLDVDGVFVTHNNVEFKVSKLEEEIVDLKLMIHKLIELQQNNSKT